MTFAFLRPPSSSRVLSSPPVSSRRTTTLVLPLSCVYLSLDLHIHSSVTQHSRHYATQGHSTPDTLFQFLHPLSTPWLTSASSSTSFASIAPIYLNVFSLSSHRPVTGYPYPNFKSRFYRYNMLVHEIRQITDSSTVDSGECACVLPVLMSCMWSCPVMP